MPRALPLYVRQLFVFLDELGWPQKRCATSLGVSQQAVNNWASGRMSVPGRYREPLIALVDIAMSAMLEGAPFPDIPRRMAQCHSYLSLWFSECTEKRGTSDTWHRQLGRKLLLTFKTPLSTHSVEEWQAELALHLEAAQALRHILLLHDITQQRTTLVPNWGPTDDPLERLWELAEYLTGQPMTSPARETRETRGLLQMFLTKRAESTTLTPEKRLWLDSMIETAQAELREATQQNRYEDAGDA